jgi:hypothetical protein
MTATLPAQVREVFDRFIHPSFYGSLVSLNPSTRNELLGVNALVYGHPYLALCAATCAIAADFQPLKRKVEGRVCVCGRATAQRNPTSGFSSGADTASLVVKVGLLVTRHRSGCVGW